MNLSDFIFADKELNRIIFESENPTEREIEKKYIQLIHRSLIFSLCFLYCRWTHNDKLYNRSDRKIQKCFSDLFKLNTIDYDVAIFVLSCIFIEDARKEVNEHFINMNCDTQDEIVFNNIHNIMTQQYIGTTFKINNKTSLKHTFYTLLKMMSFLREIKVKTVKNYSNIKSQNKHDNILDTYDLIVEYDNQEFFMYEILRKINDQYYYLLDINPDEYYFKYQELSGNEIDMLKINKFIFYRR